MYHAERTMNPFDSFYTQNVGQKIEVDGMNKKINRAEHGSNLAQFIWAGDSRSRPSIAFVTEIMGSSVFHNSWSGGGVIDILASLDWMLGKGAGKRAAVLTVGVNDIVRAFRLQKFSRTPYRIMVKRGQNIVNFQLAALNHLTPQDDLTITALLSQLDNFFSERNCKNRKRFLLLYATEVWKISTLYKKVHKVDTPLVNCVIDRFNVQLAHLLTRHGGEFIDLSSLELSPGNDGIHLQYHSKQRPQSLPQVHPRERFAYFVSSFFTKSFRENRNCENKFRQFSNT